MLTSINEFINSFEYEFLFENKKVEDIYDKHYKDIPDNEFRSLIAIDPTSIIKDGGDPVAPSFDDIKKVGQYSKWLFKLYMSDLMKFEDTYKAKEYLAVFDNLKKKNVLDRDGIEKDINKYKNLPELFSAIEEYAENDDDDNVYSKGDEERKIKNDESTKMFENDNWLVVIPKTHRAACYYGNNTQWCTASKDDDGYFNQYSDEGPLYINIDKTKNEKYQFHFPSSQFMDETDAQIDLAHFYENNPDLKEFYNTEFNKNIMPTLSTNLPEGVGYVKVEDGDNYLSVSEWGSFKDLFDDDHQDFVGSLLEGDGKQYFEYHELLKYGGYDDISDKELTKFIVMIKKYISDNDIELEDEFIDADLNTLSKLYNYAKNDDELEFIWNSIDLAYTNAQESADESAAYNNITDSIMKKFNITDVEWDNDNNSYKMNLKNGVLYTFENYLSDFSEDLIEEGEIFKIKYESPYYGYSGDISEVDFADEITHQMESNY